MNEVDGVSEGMELLLIDLGEEGEEDRGARTDGLCSNVLRKQRHWQRRLAAKKTKRKEEKRRRKQKRGHQTGPEQNTRGPSILRPVVARISVSPAGGSEERPRLTKWEMKAETRERLAEAQSSGLRLCVDLSLTHLMSDKEVSRLAGQLRRLYGSNRRTRQPFHLILADLREDSRLYRECVRMNAGFLNYTMDVTEDGCLDLFAPESIVYLTPDAEQVLETLDPDKVYVLGGLVDESVQKKLSLSRAAELSVRTARLPIDEYMRKRDNAKNFHSKILAINQVFDILLTFCETGSWTDALRTWFPPGKGYVVALDDDTSLPPASPTLT
ncbi:tRNA methyltransferase 10 homolog B isoform 2-T2 [Aulostomus maculatus]